MTVHDLRRTNYQSQLRNKLVAESFYLTGNIEKYGSGINRIRSAVADADGIAFDMEELANGFLVCFTKTTRNMIIESLREDPWLTRTALATLLEKSESTIKEHLAALKCNGFIERISSDRHGELRIIDAKRNSDHCIRLYRRVRRLIAGNKREQFIMLESGE